MAKRERKVYDLVDDFDGNPLPEDTKPTTITLGGKRYSFDLSEANAKTVKDAAEVLRKVIAANSAASSTSGELSAEEKREVREWANGNGFKVGPRGRIAGDVIEAWRNR